MVEESSLRHPAARAFAAALALLAALLVVAACRPGDGVDEAPPIDLVTELAYARLTAEPETGHLPRPTDDGSGIVLPRGGRIDYFLHLPGEARLAVDGLVGEGSTLRFEVAPVEPRALAGGDSPASGSGSAESGGIESGELAEGGARAIAAGGIVRLSLTAAGEGAALRVDGPRLLGTPLPSPVELAAAPPAGAGPTEGPAADPGPAELAEAAEPADRPNLVIYLVDTLRTDHLGVYGYPEAVSPHLDHFARRAWVFDRAVAQSPWTRPSVTSIFTGLDPQAHGVNDRRDRLPTEALTLAELLSAAGYSTSCLFLNPNIAPKFGLWQGFDHYRRARRKIPMADQALARIDDGEISEPFFLYLHTIKPHAPYEPEEPYLSRHAPGVDPQELGVLPALSAFKRGERPLTPRDLAGIVALYDGEIAANDADFGALVDGLDERGLGERTMIVFVADHGEEFWDHGSWGHGHRLWREQLSMPLVIRRPGQQAGGRIAELVQHVDLPATLLDEAGVDAEIGSGRSLLPLMDPASGAETADAFARRAIYSRLELDQQAGAAIEWGDWKVIVPRTPDLGDAPRLFDLVRDPAETDDLADELPVWTGFLATELRRHEATVPGVGEEEAEIDPELRRELEALGYLN